MKRALITGIAGFAGSHLAGELVKDGWEVSGIERYGVGLNNLADLIDHLRVEECDILSSRDVGYILRKHKPELIFHLAGTSFVPDAQNVPQAAFEINIKGSLNLLEGAKENTPGARFVLISSAEVYGHVDIASLPVTEDAELSPVNIYALTKVCAENTALYYHRVSGLDCVILRPFNHIGARQLPNFVTSAFALQIARIESGKQKPVLYVGNVEAARDFTDVRDMTRAYRLAAEYCEPAVPYNICSGKAYKIKEIIDKLIALSPSKIEIRPDPKRMRASEVPIFQGDHSRFTKITGWKPKFNIDDTLKTILDYWREQVL